MNFIEKEIDLGDGRKITIETGRLARQADGSVVVKMGKTMLLATVVGAKDGKPDADFMPLSVEYQEKFASIGRFPGGFLRREGKPSDNEVLTSRLVDRALRPLFPSDYHAEVFVTIYLISAEKDVMPDALAGFAASCALSLTDIPFAGPISEVRVIKLDGKFILNPTLSQVKSASLELLVGASIDNILMVEGEMNEVSEDEMLEALKFAHEAIKIQCQAQLDLAAELNKTVKRTYAHENSDLALQAELKAFATDRIYEIAKAGKPKHQRSDEFAAIKLEFIEKLPDDKKTDNSYLILVHRYFHDIQKDVIRNLILDEGIRIDGRKLDEIRPIWCLVDFLPAAHGSAVFTRGETQSLTTITLGTKLDEKIIDEVLNQGKDKFLLHYNFPAFATGEAKPSRGVSRREVGHGNLAHRSLKRMLPTGENNPYTIRIVSDILESNGSSSMATVCAGTLALMDAGVKIKRPVSGIAMGLISSEDGRFAVLSDILGDEDHLGDMDFKVAGTVNGITACQMDIKVNGLPYEVLQKALLQAKAGRMHILEKILETISAPREDYKPHVPRIEVVIIEKEMIGALIGPGGKTIQGIQAETGTVIAIEEVGDKGHVQIAAENKAAIDAALLKVKSIVEVPEVGKTYRGKVKSIVSFGAFVEIAPGKEGLLHISEIDHKRIENVESVMKEGDFFDVTIIEIDKKTNKIKLSRKALLPKPERK